MDHLIRRSDTLTQKESKDIGGGVSISQWAEVGCQTPMEIPLESPPATLPSQNKFHWEGKPLGNLTRLDQTGPEATFKDEKFWNFCCY